MLSEGEPFRQRSHRAGVFRAIFRPDSLRFQSLSAWPSGGTQRFHRGWSGGGSAPRPRTTNGR